MKEKLLTLIRLNFVIIVLLIGATDTKVQAQVVTTESFDGTTFLPTGWSAVGTTTLWSRRTSGTFPTCTMHSGAGMLRYAARGVAAKTIQTIASPVLDLSNRGGNTPKVSLWLYRDNGSTLGDSLSVYVNTSASLSSAVLLGTIARYSKLKLPDTVATNGWYQYTFNIPSSFNTASNYLLFKGISEAGYNIHIDDIQWEEYPNLCTGKPSPGSISAGTSLICEGTGVTTLTLNGQTTGYAGISFQWKYATAAAGPYINFGGNVSSISTGGIAATRYYKCVAKCSYSGISDSTSVKTIVVISNPNPIITVTPNTGNYCQGSGIPVALKASSLTAKTYAWSPATGLNRTDTSYVLASPSATSNYSVIGTDSLGCVGTTSVSVILRQATPFTLTAADTNLCIGDSVRLIANSGGGGNTFLWTPTGQTTSSIYAKPTSNAKYSVTMKNAFGCGTTQSKNIVVAQKPKSKFGYSINGRKVTFYDSSLNATTHEWDFGDGNGSKKSSPIYVFADDGTFSVQLITKSSPCKSDTVIKMISISLSGIHDATANHNVMVYPNPCKGKVAVTVLSNSNTELVLYNSVGQKVFNTFMKSTLEEINTTVLPPGIYYLATHL